jgi:hypothetical protein
MDPRARHDRAIKARALADSLVALNADLYRIESGTLAIARALGLDVQADTVNETEVVNG